MGNSRFENCPCLTIELPMIAHDCIRAWIARELRVKIWAIWAIGMGNFKSEIAHMERRGKAPILSGIRHYG